jgi:hypothetical protein
MCESWRTLTLSDYKDQVGTIPYRKRLPTALYVHREGLASVGGSLGVVLDQAVVRYQMSAEFNFARMSCAILDSDDGDRARPAGAKAETLVRSEKSCVSGGESPSSLEARLPEFGTKVMNGKV